MPIYSVVTVLTFWKFMPMFVLSNLSWERELLVHFRYLMDLMNINREISFNCHFQCVFSGFTETLPIRKVDTTVAKMLLGTVFLS